MTSDVITRLLLHLKANCKLCRDNGGIKDLHIWRDPDTDELQVCSFRRAIGTISPKKAPLCLKHHPMESRLAPLAGHNLCIKCARDIESTLLWDLPLEDLPLYINTTWVTDSGTLVYKERLKALSSSKSEGYPHESTSVP